MLLRLLAILALSLGFHECHDHDHESLDLGRVIFTNIVYRHGARTILKPYPNDPYGNASFWPLGWGQLTQVGMQGHYNLGKWLRKRYADLLPAEYNPSDIFIHSTDVDRTLMSAYSNLAGLYEPRDVSENWNPRLRWRPIPVHTAPTDIDILSDSKLCPMYDDLYEELMNSPRFSSMIDDNKQMLETLSRGTGQSVTSLNDVGRIYDTLSVEADNSLELPLWTRDVYPQPMRYIIQQAFVSLCYTPTLARLKIGPIIGEMVDHMDKKIQGSLTQKAWIYSAHDITEASLLQALRVYNGLIPPYNSSVILELRQKRENYFVSVFYRNSSTVEPHLLTLPGCSPLCPYQKFKSIVRPIIPTDWKEECQRKTYPAEDLPDTQNPK